MKNHHALVIIAAFEAGARRIAAIAGAERPSRFVDAADAD
jgi:hypothetical protein